jgi:hypothetical protein
MEIPLAGMAVVLHWELNVRYGSFADIAVAMGVVPLSAIIGHSRGSKVDLFAIDDAHQKMLQCGK